MLSNNPILFSLERWKQIRTLGMVIPGPGNYMNETEVLEGDIWKGATCVAWVPK